MYYYNSLSVSIVHRLYALYLFIFQQKFKALTATTIY